MKNDFTYLNHILEAIKKIENYLKGFEYSDFKNNDMVIDAVVRELEIIGEAANNLSGKFKKDNPDVPIRDMSDMRNFLIHEYFGVNKKIVWDTCKNDLQILKPMIKNIIS